MADKALHKQKYMYRDVDKSTENIEIFYHEENEEVIILQLSEFEGKIGGCGLWILF